MDSLRENDEKDDNEHKDTVSNLNLEADNIFFIKNSGPAHQSITHTNEKNKIEAIKEEAQVRKEKLLKLGSIAGLKYFDF